MGSNKPHVLILMGAPNLSLAQVITRKQLELSEKYVILTLLGSLASPQRDCTLEQSQNLGRWK